MVATIVTCSRCGKVVNGIKLTEGTSGYYPRSRDGGGAWDKYMKPGEVCLCDACMSEDEQYRRDYGLMTMKVK